MKTTLVSVLAFAALGACAHSSAKMGSTASVVSDADVGRLPADGATVIDGARRALADANDGLSRARLEQQNAKNELQVARADVDTAKAEQSSADALQVGSDESQAPAAVKASQKRQDAARAHQRAADARREYAEKRVDATDAAVRTFEQSVKVASARVELSKLQALKRAKNPAANKYDGGRFETAVYDEQASLDRMQSQSKSMDEEVALSRKAWQAAKQEWDEKRRSASGG